MLKNPEEILQESLGKAKLNVELQAGRAPGGWSAGLAVAAGPISCLGPPCEPCATCAPKLFLFQAVFLFRQDKFCVYSIM